MKSLDREFLERQAIPLGICRNIAPIRRIPGEAGTLHTTNTPDPNYSQTSSHYPKYGIVKQNRRDRGGNQKVEAFAGEGGTPQRSFRGRGAGLQKMYF